MGAFNKMHQCAWEVGWELRIDIGLAAQNSFLHRNIQTGIFVGFGHELLISRQTIICETMIDLLYNFAKVLRPR